MYYQPVVSQQQTHEHANHARSNDDDRDLILLQGNTGMVVRSIEPEMSPLGPSNGNSIVNLFGCHGLLGLIGVVSWPGIEGAGREHYIEYLLNAHVWLPRVATNEVEPI